MIVSILVLGFVLRLISINQSLWLDEATSVLVARDFSFSQILTQFSPGDFHPPLYYLMLRVWVLLFGATEVAARMLSVLFGVTTIWAVYLIGKRWQVGEVAALFMATAPLHVYYSQEARMYVPATFFAALSVLFFLKIFEKPARRINWLGFTVPALALIYTDYLPGFLLIFFLFYLFVFERGHLKKYVKKWLGAAVAISLLFLPWLPTLSQQLQSGLLVKTRSPEWWKVLGRTNFKQLMLVPIKFMVGRVSIDSDIKHVLALTVPSVIFSGLFYKAAKAWGETKFLWLWLLVPAISAALLGLRLSVFSYFRLIFVLPAFYLLLAYGALSLKNKNLRLAVVGGLVAVHLVAAAIYLFNPRLHREDWRSAVAFIEEKSQGKNTAAIFVSNGQQEAYSYYARAVPSFGPEATRFTFDTIWLMRYVQPIFDPQDSVRSEVEARGYQKVKEYDFNGVVLWEYKR